MAKAFPDQLSTFLEPAAQNRGGKRGKANPKPFGFRRMDLIQPDADFPLRTRMREIGAWLTPGLNLLTER